MATYVLQAFAGSDRQMNMRESQQNIGPAIGEVPAAPAASGLVPIESHENAGKETILLAEDDDFTREAVHQILESAGYRVLVADSASSAKELCPRYPEFPNLLLADVVMPGMSGRELGCELLLSCPGLRVLLMSGYSPLLSATDSWNQEECMVKPFSMATLLRRVRQTLDEDRSIRGVVAQPAQRLT